MGISARIIRLAILVPACCLAVAMPAAAVELYVAAGAGTGTAVQTLGRGGPSTGYEFENGLFPTYMMPSTAGLDFGVIRLEGEALVDDRRLYEFELAGGGLLADRGRETRAGMANALIDIPTGTNVRPFFGAGIGYADVAVDGLKLGGVETTDRGDGVLAYQLRAGIAFTIMPEAEIILGYRYFATDDLHLNGSAGDRVTVDNRASHIGELGIRIKF